MAGKPTTKWSREPHERISKLLFLWGSNNTKQFPLTFVQMLQAEMTELRMPHSIIAKEIKVPLIAFGQLAQFPSPSFFVIKVVSNINILARILYVHKLTQEWTHTINSHSSN